MLDNNVIGTRECVLLRKDADDVTDVSQGSCCHFSMDLELVLRC